MYSTPQKRCCVRLKPDENETDIGLTNVLDTSEVVRRCLDQEVYPYIKEIQRLQRVTKNFKKMNLQLLHNTCETSKMK